MVMGSPALTAVFSLELAIIACSQSKNECAVAEKCMKAYMHIEYARRHRV